MTIRSPYLLFLGDAWDNLSAKTSIGIYEWRPENCVGQLRLPDCVPKLPLPEITVQEAYEAGARTMIIGVVTRGGSISPTWETVMIEALRAGMDLANGLHARLTDIPQVREAAQRLGRRLHDVRHSEREFKVGTGEPRSGKRLLTVGTDCSVGKMYTALAIDHALKAREVDSDFRATGQTGILIEGNGIAIDAVISDFVSGAVEALCPAAQNDHWDCIEGQGSLFHPSYAGVSLGLLHGAQPDVLVLCHEPTRTHMRGLPHQALPSLRECLRMNLSAAKLLSPQARFVGVSVNTQHLTPSEARAALKEAEHELQLPAIDPARDGVEPILNALF